MKYLDFEQPIGELEEKIEELRSAGHDADLNISEEIARLRQRANELTERIFARLTPWQVAKLARHPLRPYTLDYVERIFDDVHQLHGDRCFADDEAIVGGLARLNGQGCVFIGQQKGRNTKENIQRNFGMPRPEGYRKALRIMELADHYELPIVTFIDTPGAYPGIGAEERGQSQAIAYNLQRMAAFKSPIISVIIGEGGSGGALAIGVGDRILMLQYATYAVITPEGCASILWKDSNKAELAAASMGITSKQLSELGVIDGIVPEPPGGAHRDYDLAARNLKQAIVNELASLVPMAPAIRQQQRVQRYLDMGRFEDR